MEKQNDAYTGFARVYDLFMDNVPYEEWCEYVRERLTEHGIMEGLVLDLGCGTGKITRILSSYGYDMIGVDNSMEMLEIARAQEDAKGQERGNILYLLQDMREFELYGTVRAVCCCCDSINYILEEEELRTVFRLVNNYLDPGGLFLFDCNTPYKYETLLAENIFAENRQEGSFIWENYYDPDSGINEYDLTLYIQGLEKGTYERYEETHVQRCYSMEQIRKLLEEAGMEFLGAYDAYTKDAPRTDSERYLILARERGKKA